MFRKCLVCVLSMISVLLVACGGGGGSGSNAVAPPPVTTAPPVSALPADVIFGVITGFGSVFIDGNRFDTSNATFSKDDDSATQDDLRVGMVVELHGDMSAGTADSVEFEEDVKGPVDEINGDQLTVLGQIVLIKPFTVIDNSLDLNALVLGDILEISGLRGENDVLEATFIEGKNFADVNAYKVIGQVRNLDTTAQTFDIGGLSVDYGIAVVDDDVALTEGLTVEVKDGNKAYNPGDFTLIATKVEPAGVGVGLPDNGVGARLRMEGLITEITSGTEFQLGATTVRHDSTTTFIFGDVSLLSVGTKVQVEGRRNEDGSIDASKIKFSRNSARIEGIVELTNLDENTLSVLGITIEPLASADFEDKLNDESPFGLGEISPGDFVEIRGNSSGNRVFASEIERDDADDTRLRGPAMNVDVDSRSLTILGVSIVTSGSTRYEGFNEEVISAEAFFGALAEGQTPVQAKWDGTVTDASVAVKELSLEG